MSFGIYFLLSLLCVLTIETPILFLAIKYWLKIKLPTKEILFWSIFANLFSLPYLWFVFPLFFSLHDFIYIGEGLVVLIESFIYIKTLKINVKKAIIISLMANAASYFVGTIIR